MNIFSDQISDNDFLGRRDLSKQITTGLVRSAVSDTDGFVTALTGKWGSGKSTLMHFLKTDIRELCVERSISHVIIEFNPWMFADTDNIRFAMLKHFAECLKPEPKWKKPALFIGKRLHHLDLAHSGLGKFGKEVGELIEHYLDSTNSLAIKKKIDQLLLNADSKIFIFIDDIDRLTPKQIFEVLQVLKLSGSFKNTYYVVAYDREAVETAIETQFKDYGKKYLDKIVQADVLIPEVTDEKIEALLFDGVDNLLRDFKISYQRSTLSSVWLHHGLRLYFTTIRDVYRYLNSLQFSLPLIHEEIDIADFLILEAIRLQDIDGYQRIYDEYNKSNYSLGSGIVLSSESQLKEFKNSITRELIKFLFPEKTIGTFNRRRTNRLYDPKYFFRYFTLQISTKDISEVEFRRVMEASSDRVALFKDAMNLERLDNLLIRLNDSDLQQEFPNWNFSLVQDIYQFFNIYAESLKTKPHILADVIISLLYQKESERELYFNRFLQLLITPSRDVEKAKLYFLHFMVESKDKDNGFPNRAEEFKQFYLSKFAVLKEFYTGYLRSVQGYFIVEYEFQRPYSYYTQIYIKGLATYLPSEYSNNLSNWINNEKNLLFFLKATLLISSEGVAFRILLDNLNTLLPGKYFHESFVRGIREMDLTLLSKDEKQWREFALAYYDNKV